MAQSPVAGRPPMAQTCECRTEFAERSRTRFGGVEPGRRARGVAGPRRCAERAVPDRPGWRLPSYVADLDTSLTPPLAYSPATWAADSQRLSCSWRQQIGARPGGSRSAGSRRDGRHGLYVATPTDPTPLLIRDTLGRGFCRLARRRADRGASEAAPTGRWPCACWMAQAARSDCWNCRCDRRPTTSRCGICQERGSCSPVRRQRAASSTGWPPLGWRERRETKRTGATYCWRRTGHGGRSDGRLDGVRPAAAAAHRYWAEVAGASLLS